MATKSIRWGVLSTANIGAKRVIPAIHKSINGEVVAVASRDPQRAADFAAEHNIERSYGSYEDLLADSRIDAIYLPLPNSMHAEWAIECARAGIPVLCEKPLAADSNEAQRMVNAFAQRNLLFAEAFMYRFHPQNQRVQQMIHDGLIGELQVINSVFTFRVTDPDNIRLQHELAGGALMDVGSYCLNVMRFLSGKEPQQAQAFADFGEVDERITGILRFPNEIMGHFDASLRTQRAHWYEARGTDGRILVEEAFVPEVTADTVIHHWRGSEYRRIEIPAADHYQLMVEDFADSLLNDRPPKFPAQDAVGNTLAIEMLLASAREHAGS